MKFIKVPKGKSLDKIDVVEWKKMTGPKKYVMSRKAKWEKKRKPISKKDQGEMNVGGNTLVESPPDPPE